MSREAHYEAVGAAIDYVQETGRLVTSAEVSRRELSEQLSLVKEKQAEALGLVAMAVGDDPATESGRNALEFTQVLGSRADHLASVDAAISQADKLRQVLSEASVEADTLADRLDSAVGGGPAGGPGEEAEQMVHAMRSDITGLLHALHTVRTHLADYRSRF